MATALIAGFFAIAGGVAATLLANEGALKVVRGQADEVKRREQAHSLGAARVLVLELGVAVTYVATIRREGRWRRIGAERVPIEVPTADLRRIASTVTGEEWGDLIVAIENAQTVSNQMRLRVQPGRDVGPRLTEQEVGWLTHQEEMLQRGVRALGTIADAPPP